MKGIILEQTEDYIITRDTHGKDLKYGIVDAVPSGYLIWNIGEYAPDGFIPLCICDENLHVDVESLKAIRYDNEEERRFLLRSAGWGADNLLYCKKNIARLEKKTKRNTLEQYELDLLRKALPYLMKIKWS